MSPMFCNLILPPAPFFTDSPPREISVASVDPTNPPPPETVCAIRPADAFPNVLIVLALYTSRSPEFTFVSLVDPNVSFSSLLAT